MSRTNRSTSLPVVTTHVSLSHGSQAGSIRIIAGVETYATIPPSGSKEDAILLFTDGFGINAESNRLLADEFAANGYFVVMPDLFFRDSVPQSPDDDFEYDLWEMCHPPASAESVIRTVLVEMRKAGAKRIGGVGYTIGARYLAKYMSPSQFYAGFMGHPDRLAKEDVMAINKPVSIAFATEGSVPCKIRQETEKLLSEKELPFQVTVFSRASNGFAVQARSGSPYQKFVRDETVRQAVQWLNLFMKGNGQNV